MSDKGEDPKIIIDEDWKAQVQAEKESADRQQDKAEQNSAQQAEGAQSAPSVSFADLVSSFAFQAMTAMGKIPDPAEGHAVVRPDVAKHYIDLLGMLDEKTKGNLTDDESAMMENLLHELRMAYVMTSAGSQEAEPPKDEK
jgi:hypothetical protein